MGKQQKFSYFNEYPGKKIQRYKYPEPERVKALKNVNTAAIPLTF